MTLDSSCFQMHIHNGIDKFLLKSSYKLALFFLVFGMLAIEIHIWKSMFIG